MLGKNENFEKGLKKGMKRGTVFDEKKKRQEKSFKCGFEAIVSTFN